MAVRLLRRGKRANVSMMIAPETANILSHRSFGLDPTELVLGASVVVTFDQPFINNFEMHREVLIRRLKAMTVQLRAPYHNARLPALAMPEHVLRVSKL
ncbi:MAG: hypothetical protein ACE5LU_05880 [Anaerolineae bacterium]